MMLPTKGRTVFFVLPCGASRPATVIEVFGELLCLNVFLKPSDPVALYQENVPYSPLARPGTWHWPERKGDA